MCMVDGADDRCNILRDENRKARKVHLCSECARKIQPGETYNLQVAQWEGTVDDYKTCQHCEVAKRWLTQECGGYLYQGVEEDISEHASEYRNIGLWRLVVGFRRNWGRFDGQGLMALPKMPPLSAP